VTREPRAHAALASLPPASAALVAAVLRAADEDDVSVLLVGGPVRDFLLGRPLVDVDLLIEDADPARAGALAARAAGGTGKVTRHDRFGTAELHAPEASVDFATVRSERYAHPGALPTVAAGDLAQDLARRDFSVNALALPLSRAARARHPEIVDLFDGASDLAARRLRVLHDHSFHDDPTRALRAARLGPRLGFALTAGTRAALRNALRDGCFGAVSGDRLRRELERVFEDANRGLDPARALRLLDDWHVLGALEPGLALPRASALPLRRLGRAIAAPPWKGPRWRPWMAGFGVWLAPLASALRRRALHRFGLRGEPAHRVAALPQDAERAIRALARARGRGAIDAVLGELSEEALYAVFAGAPPAMRRRVARYANDDRQRRPPVGGDDLVAAGLAGPSVGRALARIRAAYLDGALRSRDEALALVQELARPSRQAPRSGARSEAKPSGVGKVASRAARTRRSRSGSRS
jgi:tRNA nucleotidyltransferase (CCA-adding enzyme)